MAKGLNYYTSNNLINENSDNFNDNLVKNTDSSLAPILKDLDGNVKYFSVLSQEDFNKSEPDNDTVYFINNITDEPLSLTNILDVAVSWMDKSHSKPEFIWMLTADTELEYVYLYKMPLNKGTPELVKEYEGYVDGSLTFDGTFEYTSDLSKSVIVTNNEPFVVLINTSGELYAFPSLKYKTKGKDAYKAIYIDGSDSNRVQTCSIDKGYCSDLFRADDQGIVIAYSINEDGKYNLCYKQYGYPNEEAPTVKMWGAKTVVCSKPENIYRVTIRRFSDYRLGLTYNFWETKEGVTTSKTEFRYSQRIYAGVAYHPEFIEINEIPTLRGILYGATTNDDLNNEDAGTIPKPILQLGDELKVRELKGELDNRVNHVVKTYEIDLIFQLSAYNESISSADDIDQEKLKKAKVDLELVSTKATSGSSESNYDLGSLVDWQIVSEWSYEQYKILNDPAFEYCTAAPFIKNITSDKDKIVVTLEGKTLPACPFKLITTSNWGSQITLRYRGDSFNDYGRNISGWFALEDFKGGEFGQVYYESLSRELHNYRDYTKKIYDKAVITSTKGSVLTDSKNFYINGFNYSTSNLVSLKAVQQMDNETTAVVGFNVSCSGFAECKGVKNIDV